METIILILITILGLILGSFFGCIGYRIPNKVKLIYPRSHCSECKKTLKWYMNIPVFSFIFLKGRCAYCKKPINYIFPFVEIATALLFLCNYLLFDFNYDFWICTVLSCALMVTVVSDFLYYYISDRVLVVSGISLIIIKYIFLGFTETFYSILAGILIFLLMMLIKFIGNKIYNKESLGDGDIKLMGIISLGVGLLNGLLTLFFGSLIALVFSFIIIKKNKEGIIPFGPFLLIGALIIIYLSNVILPFIEGLLAI